MPLKRTLLAVAAFVLWACATPAAAAIRVDLNGDGVPDTVTLTAGAQPSISLSLSGQQQIVVLPLKEAASSIVVTDLDRDGRMDLAAVSGNQHRLFFWRNKGNERFIRWRRHVTPRTVHRVTLQRPANQVHKSAADPDESDSLAPRTDDKPTVHVDVFGVGPDAGGAAPFDPRSLHRPDSPALRSSASRAPPTHTAA